MQANTPDSQALRLVVQLGQTSGPVALPLVLIEDHDVTEIGRPIQPIIPYLVPEPTNLRVGRGVVDREEVLIRRLQPAWGEAVKRLERQRQRITAHPIAGTLFVFRVATDCGVPVGAVLVLAHPLQSYRFHRPSTSASRAGQQMIPRRLT